VGDETVSLGDTTWTAVEIDGAPVEDDGAPTLVFDLEESRVAGSGGLNRLMGTFSLTEDELRFGPLATTLMAGPEDVMERERAFLDALARVTGYDLDGRSLTLDARGEVVARFSC
jgi:copper homeostasis protein (lipoprotein)